MSVKYAQKKSRLTLKRFFPVPKYLNLPTVGIDISDRSVKFLEFAYEDGRRVLGRYGERGISEGIMAKGMIQQVEALAEILGKLKDDEHLHAIRASLPEEHAYIFQTVIPADTDYTQARNILEFQLEEHVPIPSQDAIFDYEVLENPLQDRAHVHVAVSVYSKGIVNAYLSAFTLAGLLPLSIEMEASAMARAVVQEGDKGTYLLVDFGRMRTGIAIVTGASPHFTSTVSVGSHPISQAIEKHLNASPEEVVRFKNNIGLTEPKKNQELYMAMMGAASVLKDEIEKHLMYWRTRKSVAGESVSPAEKIILCGGGANLAGLVEYLSGNLRLPVVIGNVWQNAFSFDDTIPEIDRAHSLGYGTAIGLALRQEP